MLSVKKGIVDTKGKDSGSSEKKVDSSIIYIIYNIYFNVELKSSILVKICRCISAKRISFTYLILCNLLPMKSRLKLREAIAKVSFHFTLNVLPDLESEFFILSKYDTYQLKNAWVLLDKGNMSTCL